MDNHSPSPNTPATVEQPAGVGPENLATPQGPEVPQGGAPTVETAPAPGGPGSGDPGQGTAGLKLTADEVAVALAAAPPAQAQTTSSPIPAVAGDVDLIEPEWVEKASEVVQQHQGDPYGEEEGIEVLQEEYLKKRYGIIVSNPKPDDTKPKGT